jgi:hypothetical protein
MAWFSGLVYGMQKLQISINSVKLVDFMSSFVKNGTYKVSLITTGRRTGREHSVWLRAVAYEGKIYLSRRNENSDWLKNALAHPQVRVWIEGQIHSGIASLVTDRSLAKKISELKYPGEARAGEARVVLQIILD